MTVAPHNHHSRQGIAGHDLVADTTSGIVKSKHSLLSYKITNRLVGIGQGSIGRRCIMIQHHHKLIGIVKLLPSHLFKGLLNTRGIVMGQDQVRTVKHNGTGRCLKNLLNKGRGHVKGVKRFVVN